MKIVMLGFLCESEYFLKKGEKDRNSQVAARKLEMAFLEGMLSYISDLVVFGFFPATTFPGNPHKAFGRKKWNHKSARCTQLPFLNINGIKLISRTISLILELTKECIKPQKPHAISIYSTHLPFLISAFITNLIFKVKFFVIIPDLPEYMNFEKNKKLSISRRIQYLVTNYLVCKANGLSVVTSQILKRNRKWSNVANVVIEGMFLDDENISQPSSPPPLPGTRPYVLYSGGLSNGYGIDIIIHTFLSRKINFDLYIAGKGELSGWIREISQKHENIKFLGFLNQTQLKIFQRNAKALLLTRDPLDEFTKLSFPSKLIEYMASGTPVLCTRLEAIPEEYFHYIIPLTSASADEIQKNLERLSGSEVEIIKSNAAAGRNFILNKKVPREAIRPYLNLIGAL